MQQPFHASQVKPHNRAPEQANRPECEPEHKPAGVVFAYQQIVCDQGRAAQTRQIPGRPRSEQTTRNEPQPTIVWPLILADRASISTITSSIEHNFSAIPATIAGVARSVLVQSSFSSSSPVAMRMTFTAAPITSSGRFSPRVRVGWLSSVCCYQELDLALSRLSRRPDRCTTATYSASPSQMRTGALANCSNSIARST